MILYIYDVFWKDFRFHLPTLTTLINQTNGFDISDGLLSSMMNLLFFRLYSSFKRAKKGKSSKMIVFWQGFDDL